MKVKSILSVITIATAIFSYSFVNAQEKKSSNKEEYVPTHTKEELLSVLPGDVVLGDKNAKVTMIEYASMTCSHCASFYKNTYPELKEKYIDTGKVKFIFRPFPLDEPSLRATMLAYCAGEERFHKFVDVIFTTQSNWAFSKNYLEVLANIGKLGGLPGGEFDKCLADKQLEQNIMQSKVDAVKVLQVRSTPTFFIDGVLHKGAHDFKYFSNILDKILGE